MRKALTFAVVLAVTAGATQASQGARSRAGLTAAPRYALSATMTAAQVTKPRTPQGNVANARGSLAGSVTIAKRSTANWTLRFSGLTGKATATDVRYPAGAHVNIIKLCAPCANGVNLVTTFPSKAVAQAFLKQAVKGKADVVVKTKRNPGGEVRGVLKAHAG